MESNEIVKRFLFREIKQNEANEAADIEQICFPPNEACSRERIRERVDVAAEIFLVAVDRNSGKIAGFLNGIATDEEEFRDEFFIDASLNTPNGKNIMICGLDVLPEYRMIGLGRELMNTYCKREASKGRKKLILTCLDEKIDMYKKMGYKDKGISVSEWGGEKWHEMYLSLEDVL